MFDACVQVQGRAVSAGRLPATGGNNRLAVAVTIAAAAIVLRFVVRAPRRSATLLAVAALAVASLVATTQSRPAAAATCAAVAPPAIGLPAPLAFESSPLAKGGGEPNVAVSPNGQTVLVDGLGDTSPAVLFRSTDHGAHFTKLNAVFPSRGGGDFDMRFIDDHTVIAADLSLRNGIYIHRSTDAGEHWTSSLIQFDVFDRPWLDHFGADKVYVAAKGFDGIPYLFTSNDGGKTFGSPLPIPIPIYGTGTTPKELGGTSPTPVEMLTTENSYVDHILVDPKSGDVYVLYGIDGIDSWHPPSAPVGYSNRLYVAHLENGSMVSRPVFLGGPNDSFISGFNWLTIDSAGTLYALGDGSMNGHHSARLWYSKDKAKTWTGPADLAPKGAANVYGSIAGGDAGVLSLVYLRGSNEDPSTEQDWFVEMARVTGADTKTPAVERTRPVALPVHQRDICFDGILCGLPGFGNDRNLLDYIWNAVGSDGTAYAVVASDGPATGHPKSEAEGTPDVIFLRQTAGPSHGRGAPS
jgi:hypothetical protein